MSWELRGKVCIFDNWNKLQFVMPLFQKGNYFKINGELHHFENWRMNEKRTISPFLNAMRTPLSMECSDRYYLRAADF